MWVWEGIRALDYLAGRPDIDASRLGCTGNSGGGTQTSYLMALDDRIAAAAPIKTAVEAIGCGGASQAAPFALVLAAALLLN